MGVFQLLLPASRAAAAGGMVPHDQTRGELADGFSGLHESNYRAASNPSI
jgi:hypothetical protein